MMIQTKRIAACLALAVLCASAALGFTEAEKANVLRMRAAVSGMLQIHFYASDEYWHNPSEEGQLKALELARTSRVVARDGARAIGWVLGSFPTGPPQNRPFQEVVKSEIRMPRARSDWARAFAGTSPTARRTREALDALIPLAVTNGITIYSDRIYKQTLNDAFVNVDLSGDYLAREPDWWPFLVRRSSDGIGSHGHFERATVSIATGLGYLFDGNFFVLDALTRWNGAVPEKARRAYRIQAGASVTGIRQLLDVQSSAFDIVAPEFAGEPDIARLGRVTELAVSPAGAAGKFRGLQMFGLREVLEVALATGQTQVAAALAEATEKFADAWGNGVDFWAHEAIRFPCLEGFESAGCEQGNPVEPVFP